MRPGLPPLRVWVAAHRGLPAAAALAVLCVSLTAFAKVAVPTWTTGTRLPLWALTPGLVSIVAATATGDRLAPMLVSSSRARVALARLGWCLVAVAVTAMAAWPVAATTGETAIPVATGVLVGLTFGLSCLAGNAAAGLGAATVAVAVTFGSRVPAADPLRWLIGSAGSWALAVVGLAVISVGCYSAVGPRSATPDDAPT